MAQQLSPLKLLLLLFLLWFTACRYTKSAAMVLRKAEPGEAAANMCGRDDIKVNVKSDVGAGGGTGGGADKATNVNDCFEKFLQDGRNASNTYASSYVECYDFDRESQLRFAQQQQPRREGMTVEMTKMCKGFHDCSRLESDLAFFECNTRNSYKNLNTLMHIYLNSSAAIVELDDEYQEAEKVVLLCTIAAEEEYFKSSTKAYARLSKCLESS